MGSLQGIRKELYSYIPYFVEHHSLPKISITKDFMSYGVGMNTLLLNYEKILQSLTGMPIESIRGILTTSVTIQVKEAESAWDIVYEPFKKMFKRQNIASNPIEYSTLCTKASEKDEANSCIQLSNKALSSLSAKGYTLNSNLYIKRFSKLLIIIDPSNREYADVYILFSGSVPISTALYDKVFENLGVFEGYVQKINNIITPNTSNQYNLISEQKLSAKSLYNIAINSQRAAYHALNGGLTQYMIDNGSKLLGWNNNFADIELLIKLLHSHHISYVINVDSKCGLVVNFRVSGKSLSTFPQAYKTYIPLLIEVEGQCLYTWKDAKDLLRDFISLRIDNLSLASELWELLESVHKIGQTASYLEHFVTNSSLTLSTDERRKDPIVRDFRLWYFN